jgi:hypothetical protein
LRLLPVDVEANVPVAGVVRHLREGLQVGVQNDVNQAIGAFLQFFFRKFVQSSAPVAESAR